jgi:hypothetical protein
MSACHFSLGIRDVVGDTGKNRVLGFAMTEPCFDVAHLGHVELYTDKFDESLDFFTRVYGLKLSGRDETSAYLRAWDDLNRPGFVGGSNS